MAKVTGTASQDDARALRLAGASIHAAPRDLAAPLVYATWQPTGENWDTGSTVFADVPYTLWTDAPLKWSDALKPWDFTQYATRPTVARFHRSATRKGQGGYAKAAAVTKRAAAAWALIGADQRQRWTGYADNYRDSTRRPVINPSSGSPRYPKPSNLTGWQLFRREFATTDPDAPTAPTRYAPTWDTAATAWDGYASSWDGLPATYTEPTMIEFLKGANYEARLSAVITATTGRIDVVMYQASASWTQPGVPASSFFELLKAQPARGRVCNMVLASETLGTPALPWNAAAASELSAAGWNVRTAANAPLLHAKAWAIAPSWTYAGSHNLTNRGTTLNKEAGILTNAPDVYGDALAWIATEHAAAT